MMPMTLAVAASGAVALAHSPQLGSASAGSAEALHVKAAEHHKQTQALGRQKPAT